jgi:hypothetical protein
MTRIHTTFGGNSEVYFENTIKIFVFLKEAFETLCIYDIMASSTNTHSNDIFALGKQRNDQILVLRLFVIGELLQNTAVFRDQIRSDSRFRDPWRKVLRSRRCGDWRESVVFIVPLRQRFIMVTLV